MTSLLVAGFLEAGRSFIPVSRIFGLTQSAIASGTVCLLRWQSVFCRISRFVRIQHGRVVCLFIDVNQFATCAKCG